MRWPSFLWPLCVVIAAAGCNKEPSRRSGGRDGLLLASGAAAVGGTGTAYLALSTASRATAAAGLRRQSNSCWRAFAGCPESCGLRWSPTCKPWLCPPVMRLSSHKYSSLWPQHFSPHAPGGSVTYAHQAKASERRLSTCPVRQVQGSQRRIETPGLSLSKSSERRYG